MPATLDPVRPIRLSEIQEARKRIAQTIVRTPLIRLELGPDFPDIRLKLENLQPINAYKLRGATNAVALLPDSERKRGVWTISAGNAGQGIAYAARAAGVPCAVVVVETAPKSKLERMKALGAKLIPVPYDVAWKALDERAFPGAEGTFVHPFDDDNFITGHGRCHRKHWRRRADHRRGQRNQGAQTGNQTFWRRAGDGSACCAFVRERFATGLPELESLVCRWRRRPKHVPAHVGTNEA